MAKNILSNVTRKPNTLETRVTALENSQSEIKAMLESQQKVLLSIQNSLNTEKKESEEKSSKKSTTSKKTSTKKSSSKKSATQTSKKSGQTWEEHLDEVFGDKETRTKFVELRNKVAQEFKSLGESEDLWIPKKSYKKVLTETTESLGGKFDKKKVRAAFLKAAK